MARKVETAARATLPEHVPCAHETCDLKAMVRVRTSTGWANLCVPHYSMQNESQAIERFAELGLERLPNEGRDVWRKRIMAWVKAHARIKRFDAAEMEDKWAREA
jgi:hypothetical protein